MSTINIHEQTRDIIAVHDNCFESRQVNQNMIYLKR